MSTPNTVARAIIFTTGGSDTAVETESYQVLVTPHLPEYGLRARLFQRRDKSGETWLESGQQADKNNKRLEDDIKVSEDGEILSFTPEAARMLQARLLSVSEKYSGATIVPLTSEDIDTLANTRFPDLPESVIAKAVEVSE